ncbi:hypothetical protein D3C81_2252670 [compost metagenome]
MPLLCRTASHLPGDIRCDIDGRQLVPHQGLGQCAALVSGLAVITQGHFRIFPQAGRAALQE